jgi:hypothetical protein
MMPGNHTEKEGPQPEIRFWWRPGHSVLAFKGIHASEPLCFERQSLAIVRKLI